jgi:hypothetical protein
MEEADNITLFQKEPKLRLTSVNVDEVVHVGNKFQSYA